MPTFHVENFGCRATQADGASLERQFESRGLAHAEKNHADFVILNTCTVTHSADQDARAAIRRLQRQNPRAKILVTGCYAQRAPEEIAALPGVTAVIGNSHKHNLAEIALRDITPEECGERKVDKNKKDLIWRTKDDEFNWHSASSAAARTNTSAAPFAAEETTFVPLSSLTPNTRNPEAESRTPHAALYISNIFAHTELLAAPVFEGEATGESRTRPNLKVQDGCDNRCSFCIIPSVRGQSRSLPVHHVIREVSALVAAGYKELVISGINLGRWGRDLGFPHSASMPLPIADFPKPDAGSRKPDFVFLLESILSQTQLEKLRISSVEPMDWTDELIALVADSPRIARHAHIPLQSASDAVLRRMHRKYRPWHYREKIEKIRAALPTAAIGADVMVGFPGETDAEFDATRRFIAGLPFTYLHVFTYSARPGTPAAAMPNQVPINVARERNRILRDLAAEKKHAFMQSFVGKTLPAITLNGMHDHATQNDSAAFSDNHSEPLPAACRRGESERRISRCTEALTDNFQKLYLPGTHPPNRWLTARIASIKNGAFVADPLPA